jgi:Fe2+ or Zn2+ uptake regulation protein
MTTQRRLILESLEALTDHPSAEDVYLSVREADPSLNLSTVYRTLRWLQTENLLQARIFEEDRRLERFDPAEPSEHYHFRCTRCKQVVEFDSKLVSTIREQFETASGAQVETGTVILYGQCAHCLKSETNA